MPNWCDNSLTITGPTTLIKSLFGKGFSLQDLYPCPQELLDLPSPASNEFSEINIKKYGEADWYNWCVKNWGTKWDPGPFEFEIFEVKTKGRKKKGQETESYLQSQFQSAWSPPTSAFEFLANKYPELSITLEYFESGCCFFGVARGSGGDWEDDFHEYDGAANLQELLKECPCDLAQSELEYLLEMEAEQNAQDEEVGQDDDS